MKNFNVTFNIVTEKSAQDGDVAEFGFICEGVSLSEAVYSVTSTFSNTVDGQSIEFDSKSIRATNGMNWSSGEFESRAMHRPANCSNASWARICRLFA